MYGPALSDGRGGSQQGSSGATRHDPSTSADGRVHVPDLPHGGLDHANVSRFAALSTLWMALWKPGLTCCKDGSVRWRWPAGVPKALGEPHVEVVRRECGSTPDAGSG